MIISRTPLRISFTGGGSDLPAYYQQYPGKVVSTTIDKYVYVTVNKLSEYFDYNYMLKYSKTEMCNKLEDIQHPIIRETLKWLNIKDRLEITSMADLPAGTGLGSSSSYTVGLLHALYAYYGEYVSKEKLAQDACTIEIELINEPIGRQDQYAASYGGLKVFSFNKNDTVDTNPVICYNVAKDRLSRNLLLFYTGITRKASDVLTEQKKKTEIDNRVKETITYMVDQCDPFLESLGNEGILNTIGYVLHRSWLRKKSLVDSISNKEIDNYYHLALQAGAIGGKLCGSGAGGCLLFYVEQSEQEKVRLALNNLREIKFDFDNEGTKIIYISG
jgi:D-glycero-alpha-D-manno-heptose-7-phosphate kinase